MRSDQNKRFWRTAAQCAIGAGVLGLITLACLRFGFALPTTTCLYLIVIVLLSLRGSFFASAIISCIAVISLDYYFVPPLFSFHVNEPSHAIALITFLITSAVITQLVSRVHHLAETRLRQSEAYLAEAQSLSHTGSLGWNVTTGEIRWSDETFRIFEFDPTLKPTLDLVLRRSHPEDLALVKQAIESAIKGENLDFEHRLLMPDGSVRHLRIVTHRAPGRAGEIEFVGAVMDITQSKRAESALRQAEAELAHVTRVSTMGELAASIAHEVNQPLAGIVMNGNASLRWLASVKEECAPLDEARAALHRIVRDGSRAGEVIARIRTLFKKTDTAKEPVDLNEVIREVIDLIRDELQRHKVALQLQLADELPAAPGDRVQLQQVIMNLILNAIEAMSAVELGKRSLSIRTTCLDGDQIRIEVQDTGIGFDPGVAGKIFDPFYTTKPGGLGMGLSISRSIVESHTGRLWATPNDGVGTTFHITLSAPSSPVADELGRRPGPMSDRGGENLPEQSLG